MSESLIGHTFTTIPAMLSAKCGFPLFLEVRSRWLEKIFRYLHLCKQAVPEESVVDTRDVTRLELLDLYRGRTIVCRTKGLPLKTTEDIYYAHLDKAPSSVGYVGTLSPNDPLRDQVGILVDDLDIDRSGLVKEFEPYLDSEQSHHSLDSEYQGFLLKRTLKRASECSLKNWNNRFLEQWLANDDRPERDVAVRFYNVEAKLNSELTRPDSDGSVIEPDEATRIIERATYEISPWLLKNCMNQRPPTAGLNPSQVAIIGTLETLQKDHVGESGFTEADIATKAKMPKTTTYTNLKLLKDEKGLIKVLDSKTPTSAELYHLNDDAFKASNVSLPTWEEYQEAQKENKDGEVWQEQLAALSKLEGNSPVLTVLTPTTGQSN
jgi:hypothetical protein